jgi:outer membrane receptor for ferrienterochelin and colicins
LKLTSKTTAWKPGASTARSSFWANSFSNWAISLGASWHRTRSQFGPNNYAAEQKSLYWQTLFQNIISNTNHKILVAPSIQYDDIQESVNEGNLDRREFVPG